MTRRYHAEKCPCGHPACQSWHVYPSAAVQGVSLTREQAEGIAKLLNRHPEWEGNK
jgi:hypothetical protein